ncbi:MAG: ParB N-terminal domain-containing protein [Planctomycetota bacterium]|nr:ParB N-terminal domain-containing protein [Planctomycetota bacterium]MDA1214817.1 ParB N-terminal domain-containing protein [Planctomycetota bacterium]
MEIRRIAIDELKPAPYNPRRSLTPECRRYRKLQRSIREFDLVQPLVWNEQTGHVVAGNQRLQILRDDGVGEVDVVVVSLPLTREKALNIALNNTAVGGEWETSQLLELLEELHRCDDIDSTLTGFDDDELRSLTLAPVDTSLPDELDSTDTGRVVVRFDVAVDHWDAVKADLDPLVAAHRLHLHVKHPRERSE